MLFSPFTSVVAPFINYIIANRHVFLSDCSIKDNYTLLASTYQMLIWISPATTHKWRSLQHMCDDKQYTAWILDAMITRKLQVHNSMDMSVMDVVHGSHDVCNWCLNQHVVMKDRQNENLVLTAIMVAFSSQTDDYRGWERLLEVYSGFSIVSFPSTNGQKYDENKSQW